MRKSLPVAPVQRFVMSRQSLCLDEKQKICYGKAITVWHNRHAQRIVALGRRRLVNNFPRGLGFAVVEKFAADFVVVVGVVGDPSEPFVKGTHQDTELLSRGDLTEFIFHLCVQSILSPVYKVVNEAICEIARLLSVDSCNRLCREGDACSRECCHQRNCEEPVEKRKRHNG